MSPFPPPALSTVRLLRRQHDVAKLPGRRMDDMLDGVHGGQQLSLFHAHHDSRCFLPMHIYEATTGKPAAVILRPGKPPGGAEVACVLRHVVTAIRRHWPPSRSPDRDPSGDGLGRVTRLARGQHKPQRVAEAIGETVQFAKEPAP